MGSLVDLQRGSTTSIDRAGVFVAQDRSRLKRLSLGAPALLYLCVVGEVTDRRRAVPPGVYEVGGTFEKVVRRRGREVVLEAVLPARLLVVEPTVARFASEAEALRQLGACEALLALGLGDAAISLQLGDLTNARYQWLRAREGL